jgi:alpha/beta superfamily hydrolase
MNVPSLPAQTTPFVWGAAAGALALAIVGFTWGGWVSASTAERLAATRADAATVAALSPICVTQFEAHPKARASLAALKAANTWEQADYVRTGGWATMPGSSEPNREVAAACAEALMKTK